MRANEKKTKYTVRLFCGGALLAAALAVLNVFGEWSGIWLPGTSGAAGQWKDGELVNGQLCWQVDLTHDGKPEKILFDAQGMEENGWAQLCVQRANGTSLYEATLSTSHAGWGTYAVYTDEAGQAWLLEYQPYFGQGMGEYTYTLFDFTGKEVTTKETSTVTFSAGMPYAAEDNDVDALVAFTDRVNELWGSAALLVSSDTNVRANLTDAAGEPYEPMQLNWNYGTLANPLRYTEYMDWTAMLTDEDEAYAALSRTATTQNLRARLEAGNAILARHRAKVQESN